MLEWIKPYLPDGVEVVYRRHLEAFDDLSEYDRELDEAKQQVLKQNDGKLPELTDAMKIATELNVRLKPGQDDDPDWREKVELEHQAIFYTKTLNELLSAPGMVPVSPTYFPGLLVTGSTKRSMAKFWAGVGALQAHGDSYREIVLSPKQLNAAEFEWQDVNMPGLEGKNFKKIRTTQK